MHSDDNTTADTQQPRILFTLLKFIETLLVSDVGSENFFELVVDRAIGVVPDLWEQNPLQEIVAIGKIAGVIRR